MEGVIFGIVSLFLVLLCLKLSKGNFYRYILYLASAYISLNIILYIEHLRSTNTINTSNNAFILYNGFLLFRIIFRRFIASKSKRQTSLNRIITYIHPKKPTFITFDRDDKRTIIEIYSLKLIPKLIFYYLDRIITYTFKIILNWYFFIIALALFIYRFNIKPYDLETVTYFFDYLILYFPIAWFVLFFRFLRKISKFYSVSVAICILVILPVLAFLLPQEFWVKEFPPLNLYLAVFVFVIPSITAFILILILSIPSYIRLLIRKPQYFMFSIFSLLLLVFFGAIEYRFYVQTDGYYKYTCNIEDARQNTSKKVLRIIGSYGEGTGFFIMDSLVITNRHVVEGEQYPKIILPNGNFITPVEIKLSKIYDLAFLIVKPINYYNSLIIPNTQTDIKMGEEVLSFGYPLGSDIKGPASIIPQKYEQERTLPRDSTRYLQFASPLVAGMSGGPVVDKCGSLIGINTSTTTGTSLAIDRSNIDDAWTSGFDSPYPVKLNPGSSPQESVFAYYYLLKARDTASCYDLLSDNYKKKSTYQEWTARFPEVIDVVVIAAKEIRKDLVYVLFGMAEWVDGEQVRRIYEGTWETVKQGDEYLLNRSNITQIDSFYDSKGADYYLKEWNKK